MGNVFSDPKSKIIIVGLDNAGKSTLINKMQPDDVSFYLILISTSNNKKK